MLRVTLFDAFVGLGQSLRRTSAAGLDGVPAGLVGAMGADLLRCFYRSFCDRLLGRGAVPVDGWSVSLLRFSGQAREAEGDVRELATHLPRRVLCKVVRLFLVFGYGPYSSLAPTQCAWAQGGPATAYSQSLLQTAAEWIFPLLIASVDVRSAFDRIRPTIAATAVHERGAHPSHVAASLREMLPATAVRASWATPFTWAAADARARHARRPFGTSTPLDASRRAMLNGPHEATVRPLGALKPALGAWQCARTTSFWLEATAPGSSFVWRIFRRHSPCMASPLSLINSPPV